MYSEKQNEIVNIIEKFANSGWDLIDVFAKTWLKDKFASDNSINKNLMDVIAKADKECGNCGCEYDPLYKKVLQSDIILSI